MDDAAIRKEAVRYFRNLFSADPIFDFQLLHVIPNLSFDIDNIWIGGEPLLRRGEKGDL